MRRVGQFDHALSRSGVGPRPQRLYLKACVHTISYRLVMSVVSSDLVNDSLGSVPTAIPLYLCTYPNPGQVADMLLTFASVLRPRSGITAAEQLSILVVFVVPFISHLDTRTLNVSLCLRMDEHISQASRVGALAYPHIGLGSCRAAISPSVPSTRTWRCRCR